jgi:YD repeat-containing protein
MRSTVCVLVLLAAACTEEHRAVRDAAPEPEADASRDARTPESGDSDADAEPESDASHDARTPDSGDSDADTPNPSECQVTTSYSERGDEASDRQDTQTWSYDPDSRRLVTTVYAYDIDEAGRTWRVYGRDQGGLTRYWTNTYDAQGNLSAIEHYTSGVFTYTNTYEGDQLKTVRLDPASSESPSLLERFYYDDASAPKLWTKRESDRDVDGTIDYSHERTISGNRTATTRSFGVAGLQHEYQFIYDGDRIERIDRDGGYWPGEGPDGTPNIRFEWKRDASGNVVEFTQDGTDSFDAPFLNGEPDFKETYSEGCAPLLQQFPWLAHEPAPNSIGPRFRDDGD